MSTLQRRVLRVLLSLAHLLLLIGYGVALHDFAHQVYQLKGTSISLEGGYIGFLFMVPFILQSIRKLYKDGTSAYQRLRWRPDQNEDEKPSG